MSLLMVGVIALSGKNPPKARVDPPGPQPLDPNAARIQEYQKRIEEQARKLQYEQAQLAHTQQSLEVAPNAPTAAQPPFSSRYSATLAVIPAEDPIQMDRKKREYNSLFASNIALTYRQEAFPPERSRPAAMVDSARAFPLSGYRFPVTSELPAPSSSSPALPRSDSLTRMGVQERRNRSACERKRRER